MSRSEEEGTSGTALRGSDGRSPSAEPSRRRTGLGGLRGFGVRGVRTFLGAGTRGGAWRGGAGAGGAGGAGSAAASGPVGRRGPGRGGAGEASCGTPGATRGTRGTALRRPGRRWSGLWAEVSLARLLRKVLSAPAPCAVVSVQDNRLRSPKWLAHRDSAPRNTPNVRKADLPTPAPPDTDDLTQSDSGFYTWPPPGPHLPTHVLSQCKSETLEGELPLGSHYKTPVLCGSAGSASRPPLKDSQVTR